MYRRRHQRVGQMRAEEALGMILLKEGDLVAATVRRGRTRIDPDR